MVRFKTTINNTDYFLYDVDKHEVGFYYKFSTLADVNIREVNTTYKAEAYGNRTLTINYKIDNCDTSVIYTKYSIYDSNDNDLNLTQDNFTQTITNNSNDGYNSITACLKIDKGKFIFGNTYKLKIEVFYKNTNTLIGTNLDKENNPETSFTLPELALPQCVITPSRSSDNSELYWTITVMDTNFVIPDSKYSISVTNANGDNKEFTCNNIGSDNKIPVSVVRNKVTIKNNNPNNDRSYTITITADIDKDYDGNIDTTKYTASNTITNLSNDIDVGIVSAKSNKTSTNKIDLIFSNSYKLSDITKIKYSVYTNGKSVANLNELAITTGTFTSQTANDGSTYYTLTLPETLTYTGSYIIELQFYSKDGYLSQCDRKIDYIY